MSAIPPPLFSSHSSTSILSDASTADSIFTQASEPSTSTGFSPPTLHIALPAEGTTTTSDSETRNAVDDQGASFDGHSMPITPPDAPAKQFMDGPITVVRADAHPITTTTHADVSVVSEDHAPTSGALSLSQLPALRSRTFKKSIALTKASIDSANPVTSHTSMGPPPPPPPATLHPNQPIPSPTFLGTPFSTHPFNQPYEYPFPSPPLPSPPTIINPDADTQLHVQVKLLGLMNPMVNPPTGTVLPGKPLHSHSLPIIPSQGRKTPPPRRCDSPITRATSPPPSILITSLSSLSSSASTSSSADSVPPTTHTAPSPASSISSTSPLAKMNAKLVENAQLAPMPPKLATALLGRRRHSIDSAFEDVLNTAVSNSATAVPPPAPAITLAATGEMNSGVDIPAVDPVAPPAASLSFNDKKLRRRSAGTGHAAQIQMQMQAFTLTRSRGNSGDGLTPTSVQMAIDSSALLTRRRGESVIEG